MFAFWIGLSYGRQRPIRRAAQLLNEGKASEVIQLMEEELQTRRRSFEILNILLLAYIENKEWDKGLLIAEEANRLAPDNPNLHNNLGVLYRNQGKLEQAIKSFYQAYFLAPRGQDFLYAVNYGQTLAMAGRIEDATKLLKIANQSFKIMRFVGSQDQKRICEDMLNGLRESIATGRAAP